MLRPRPNPRRPAERGTRVLSGMKITTAEFVLGVANLRQLPKDSLKEIAFLGRSNVGKSSLINKLCARKALARSSSEPGKTRELNYYAINKQWYFVDLPGYGYARLPEQIRSSWGKLIEQYLKSRKELALVVQLIDARHHLAELGTPVMKEGLGHAEHDPGGNGGGTGSEETRLHGTRSAGNGRVSPDAPRRSGGCPPCRGRSRTRPG